MHRPNSLYLYSQICLERLPEREKKKHAQRQQNQQQLVIVTEDIQALQVNWVTFKVSKNFSQILKVFL